MNMAVASIKAVVVIVLLTLAIYETEAKTNPNTVSKTQGHMDKCRPSDPDFTFNWSPEEIKLGSDIHVNFKFTPTVDVNGGTANVTLQVETSEGPQQIFQDVEKFSCSTIHKFLPNVCPFKKGHPVALSRNIKVNPEWTLPPATFLVKLDMKNEHGQEVTCMTGKVIIASDYNYDDYNY